MVSVAPETGQHAHHWACDPPKDSIIRRACPCGAIDFVALDPTDKADVARAKKVTMEAQRLANHGKEDNMAKHAVAERQQRKTELVHVSLDLIDDNPWQPRQHHPQGDIDKIAESIEQVGLLHEPLARRRDGRFQLADGHLRKRAFAKLARKNGDEYGSMPLKVADLGDREMSLIAIHENMKRKDLTPIEEARSYQKHLQDFPDTSENALAKEVGISQSHLSHMLRVLELPEKVLEKVAEGKINFTQARELVCILGHEEEMLGAIGRCTGQYGSNTVAGIRQAIGSAVSCSNRFKPLFAGGYYGNSPQFDVKETCSRCDHSLSVPKTLSESLPYCDTPECWGKHQQAALDAKAADARDRAAKEIQARVLQAGIPGTTLASYREVASTEDMEDEIERLRELQEEARWQDGEAEKPPEIPISPQGLIGKKEAPAAIPEDVLARARDQLGTRAEVLCVDDLLDRWGHPKAGETRAAVLTQRDLEGIYAQECLERCTHGFHYGYKVAQETYGYSDRGEEPTVHYLCSDLKCLGKKRSAFTRHKNEERNRLRKEESRLIKEAVQHTTELTWAHMKLFAEALFLGETNTSGMMGGERWNLFRELWGKLGLEGKCDGYLGRNQREHLVKKLQSLPERELAQMLTDISFDMVRDHGSEGKFQFRTKRHLVNMGYIQEKPGRNVEVETLDGEKRKVALGSITGLQRIPTDSFPPRPEGGEWPEYVWSMSCAYPKGGAGSFFITEKSAEELQDLGVKIMPKMVAAATRRGCG